MAFLPVWQEEGDDQMKNRMQLKNLVCLLMVVGMVFGGITVSGHSAWAETMDEIVLPEDTAPGLVLEEAGEAVFSEEAENTSDDSLCVYEGDIFVEDLEDISSDPDAADSILFMDETVQDPDTDELSADEPADRSEPDDSNDFENVEVSEEFGEPEEISEAAEEILDISGEEPETIRIGSAEDWETFCTMIQEADGAPINAELTSDVTLTEESSMAGDNDIWFYGTFEGNNHTLMVNYVNDRAISPFRCVGDVTIQNLKVAGSITLTKTGSDIYHSSCVVGWSHTTTIIRNCTCSVDLRFASGTNNAYSGGYIGHALNSSVTIEDCLFDGSFGYVEDAASKPGLYCVGGFVGWGDSFRTTVKNCVNTGTASDMQYYFPIAYTSGSSSIEGCLYINPGVSCNGPGIMAVTVSGDDNVAVEVTDDPKIVVDGVNYYVSPIHVNLTPAIPDGTAFWKYIINTGSLSDEETIDGTHQITGFNQNITIGRKVKDVENTIIIHNAQEWEEFCQVVENGSSDTLLNVELANDIIIDENAPLVGTHDNPFAGTFDGKGYTIHLQLAGNHQNVAPFCQAADAVIKNLNTDGTVVSTVSNNQCYHHSGLVGGCIGDVQIINCTVDADILFPSGTTKTYSGGFIGHGTREHIRMEGCTFTGSIGYVEGAESKPGLQTVGGLVAWADAMNLEMKDCRNLGTFEEVAELSPLVRGGVSYSPKVENSYYIGTPIPNTGDSARDHGTAMITAAADEGVVLTINDDPFFTYQGTDYYVAPLHVTLKPVLPEGKVFEKYIVNSGQISDPETADGTHELTGSNAPFVVSRIIRSIEPDFQISDADDWAEFCSAVNAGTGDVILQASLTKDVVLTPDSPAAGTGQHPFNGEFDGQGYTLVIDYQGEDRYAPFLSVGGSARIHDLHTEGTITITGTGSNINHASGLIGSCPGDVTVKNCVSSVDLRYQSGVTNVYSAGFIGHTNSAKVVMEDCVFDGSIGYIAGARNKPGLANVGGLIAWGEYSSKITMKNCLNAGTFEDVSNLCPVIRNSGSVSVTDCYFTYTGIPMLGERVRKDGILVARIIGEDDLTVSGQPVYSCNGEDYFSAATPLTFSLGNEHEEAFTGYTSSSGKVSDPTVLEGTHTVSGFTEVAVTVKAHWGEDDPYIPEGFYTPLVIASGFNRDGILEDMTTSAATSIDNPSGSDGYSYYALKDEGGSLPLDGVIGTASGRHFILGDYAQENVLVVDKNNVSAEIELAEESRGTYSKLAFLVTGGNGGGTAEVKVHLSNPGDPSDVMDVPLEIEAPDWNYTASGRETVYNCGRVYVDNLTFERNPVFGLYEGTVDLSGEEYEGYIVTSATVSAKSLREAGKATICVFAVSGIDPENCTVLFDGNGGTASQKKILAGPGEQIILPGTEAREGYAITGWYDGETKVGDPGDPYTVEKSVVLQAQWRKIGYVTLTIGVYDLTNNVCGQGGTYTFNDEDMTHTAYKHTVETGSPVKIVAAPADGYIFAGWYPGRIYGTDESQIVPDSSNVNLEPVLEGKPDSSVVLCAVFRTADDIPPVIDASTVRAAVPEERAGDRMVTAGDKISVSVRITDLNGVEAAEVYFSSVDESDGMEVRLSKQDDDIWTGIFEIDSGRVLGDWTLVGVGAVDTKGDESYLLNSAVFDPMEEPYAAFADLSAFDFEVCESHVVSFVSNGGSEVAPQRVIPGHNAVKPEDPVKAGLRFVRWYTDEGLTNTYSFWLPVTDNLTLYAGWCADMALGVYNKSNPGGCQGGTIDIETGSHTMDQTGTGTGNHVIPEDLVSFTAKPADGFIFEGWYKGIFGGSGFVEAPSEELLSKEAVYTCEASEAAICAVFECAAHQWGDQKIQKATPDTDGRIYQSCTVCGAEKDVTLIPKVSDIKLAGTSYTYTGKAIKPEVIVGYTGGEFSKDNYSVTYSNNTKAGTATVKVTLRGDYYEGSKGLTFEIIKAANPLTVKGKTVKVEFSKLTAKTQKIADNKAIKVSGAQGKVTYKLVSVKKAKFKKYFKINAKTGKITVKKKLMKGTYKIKVKVTAAGNANYNKVTKSVTFKIKVK